jgi:hypothetical protein
MLRAPLAKSKDEGLSADEAELLESTLADRNLRIALSTAQAIVTKIKVAVAQAQAAQKANQPINLKQGQTTAAAELKRLDELVDKRHKAYETIGEAQIMATKTGPAIKQTVQSLDTLKQNAHTEMAKLPKG